MTLPRASTHVAELLVFQGELVDYAHEGRDVGPELGESLFLPAIVFLSRATVARSRASSPLPALRSPCSARPGAQPLS